MDKLHSLAKVALAAIGIFFAFRFIDKMIMFSSVIVFSAIDGTRASLEVAFGSVASLMFLGLCLAATCYLCLCKREQLAARIAGTNEFSDQRSQVDWLYVAFRLVCITAGLYCLHHVAWLFVYALQKYLVARTYNYHAASRVFSVELVASWLGTLAIGTYLVCGAPHFVRWHVTKTLEQCRLQEQEQELE